MNAADKLLEKWIDANTKLVAAKADEAKLRLEVIEAFPFDSSKKEGTETIELCNGYKLQAVKKQNYTLDKEFVDSILEEIEQMDEGGKFIANRLIKWNPDLVVREYKELDKKYKNVFDKILTVQDGTPSLKLIEAKR